MLRLLLFIYVNHVKYFEANPRVVHSLKVLFQIHLSSQTLSIFIKIYTLNFREIYHYSSDDSQLYMRCIILIHVFLHLNDSYEVK